MINSLQKILNHFPYNTDVRTNPYSNLASVFSTVAEVNEEFRFDMYRLNKDKFLRTALCDYYNALYSWDVSSFGFLYNGKFVKLPSFLGDSTELEEIEIADIFNLVPTSVVETDSDSFLNLIAVLDSSNPEESIINLDDYPCQLIITNNLKNPSRKNGENGKIKYPCIYIKGYTDELVQVEEDFYLFDKYSITTKYIYKFIEKIELQGQFDSGEVNITRVLSNEVLCFQDDLFVHQDRTNKVYFVDTDFTYINLKTIGLADTEDEFEEELISYIPLDEEGNQIECTALSINKKGNMVLLHEDKISFFKSSVPVLTWEPFEKDAFNLLKIVPDRRFYKIDEEVYVEIRKPIQSSRFTDYTIQVIEPDGSSQFVQADLSLGSDEYFHKELVTFHFTISSFGNWKIKTVASRRQDGGYVSSTNESVVAVLTKQANKTFTLSQENTNCFFLQDNKIIVSNGIDSYQLELRYDYYIFDQEVYTLYTFYNYGVLDVVY